MVSNKPVKFVLDCSIVMAWCFEDEITDYSEQVFESFSHVTAIVPALWPLEVSNALLTAERKKRIATIKSIEFKESLGLLPIQIDYETSKRAMGSIMEVAREMRLTIYDACYLELAMRNSLPLATFDNDLIRAVQKLNLKTFDPNKHLRH